MRHHKGNPPRNAPATAHVIEPVDDAISQVEPAWLLEIACCCPSRPAVRAVIPAAGDRPRPAELLLCGHHFRSSQEGLIHAGASVYDRVGALISSGAGLG